MPLIAPFAVVLLIMGVVVALSMKGDRKRRERLPPPVPRPVPPNYPTGVHLRWDRGPLAPPGRRDPDPSFMPDPSFVDPSRLRAASEAASRHDHATAAELFRQLLDAAVAQGVPTAPLRYALAQSLVEIGSYVEAEDVVRDGLATRLPPDEPFRGDLVAKHGEIAWALGELDRAEMLLETAATLPRQLSRAGWVELHLGLVERDRGRTPEARQLVLAALSTFDTEGEADGSRKLAHIVLASVAVGAGELSDAGEQLEEAKGLAPGDAFLEPYGSLVAAGLARARHDSNGAIDLLTPAREALDRLGLPPYVAEADVALARAHLDLGQVDEARGAYWRAIWAYDTFGCVAMVQRLRDEVATLPG